MVSEIGCMCGSVVAWVVNVNFMKHIVSHTATEPHIDPIPTTALDGGRNRVYVWLCGGVGHKYQFHEAKTK